MPRYEYACTVCGHREDQLRGVEQRDELLPCPKCSASVEHCCKGTPVMRRDVIAGMTPHTDMGYQSPVLSDSLAVHKDQINEARQRFPHHNYTPDGRMILSSHSERNKVLKELGYHDKN